MLVAEATNILYGIVVALVAAKLRLCQVASLLEKLPHVVTASVIVRKQKQEPTFKTYLGNRLDDSPLFHSLDATKEQIELTSFANALAEKQLNHAPIRFNLARFKAAAVLTFLENGSISQFQKPCHAERA